MSRRKKGIKLDGWLVLDKPVGISSNQALGKVRHAFNAQKAGHAGTLDPMASGILPIAFGEATKTIPYIMDASKGYEFTICFGQSTDTLDAEGEVVATSPARPGKEQLQAVLSGFSGKIQQIPPAFSALHINGKRAYELARAGQEVTLAAREVEILDLQLTGYENAKTADFAVRCGKGTYVRSLARDICKAVQVEGHVSALRRTKVGKFAKMHSLALDEVLEMVHKAPASHSLYPLETALDDIPALAISEAQAAFLRQGRAIALSMQQAQMTGEQISPVVAMHEKTALALGTIRDGAFAPFRVFNRE